MHARDRLNIGTLALTSPVLLSDYISLFLNPVNLVNPVQKPPDPTRSSTIRIFISFVPSSFFLDRIYRIDRIKRLSLHNART